MFVAREQYGASLRSADTGDSRMEGGDAIDMGKVPSTAAKFDGTRSNVMSLKRMQSGYSARLWVLLTMVAQQLVSVDVVAAAVLA